VQPWRHGIRPERTGRTIRFTISGPQKLCISQPGRHGFEAGMIFLFANTPETEHPDPHAPGVRYFGPGVYHENLNLKSGETIYLDGGAVVFGCLNVWDVENGRVIGRGTLIHDGPQNPATDDGWMHKPDWHGIVMHHARKIEVSGITCIVRSRTWMIQLQDSKDLLFDNINVIGGFKGNANQDGIDWLGSGDTLVRNCFFRCSDDIFALYGNTGFYTSDVAIPGHAVRHIRVEHCVLSTSVSNVVRVGWPRKIFDSGNFRMSDCDVIHMGSGGCVVPFALMELWADPDGQGRHEGYHFENIRLENWYSLTQLRYPNDGVRDVSFRDIWSFEQPSLAPSALIGNVAGVQFDNVKLAGQRITQADLLPLQVTSGVKPPIFTNTGPEAVIHYSPTAPAPGTVVTFDASAGQDPGATFEWSFGDGTYASGAVVSHVFPDGEGTLLDGSGRFRVLVKVTGTDGRADWATVSLVVCSTLREPEAPAKTAPGLTYRYYEGTWNGLPDFAGLHSVAAGVAPRLDSALRLRETDYGIVFEGFLEVPCDGGYTFTLLSNDGGQLEIGSKIIAATPPALPQPCDTVGNLVQLKSGSIGLRAGRHAIRIAMTHALGPDGFAVRWEGPRSSGVLPAQALSHN
jgi:hypothetical protein